MNSRQKLPYDRVLAQEKAIFETTEAVWEVMNSLGVKKADLAERLGVSRPRMTQVLDGLSNMTLRTVGDLAWALNSEVRISFLPAAFDESQSFSVPAEPLRGATDVTGPKTTIELQQPEGIGDNNYAQAA